MNIKSENKEMKNTKVISITNYKGGTGKTTVTFNFASELVLRNKKVLMIDFDGQGNLSKLIDDNVDKIDKTIASIMKDIINGNTPDIYIYKTQMDNLDIIACNVFMAEVKTEIMLALSRETILDRVIDRIKALNHYDYILIDNAPSIEIDFVNSIVASDEVIIVSSPDTFSTLGIENLLNKLYIVKKYFNKKLKIKGILMNNINIRSNFNKDMIDAIKKSFKEIKVFDTFIRSSVKVSEAMACKIPVLLYEKNNKVAMSFSEFTDEYLLGK